jgi:hypothetical protein
MTMFDPHYEVDRLLARYIVLFKKPRKGTVPGYPCPMLSRFDSFPKGGQRQSAWRDPSMTSVR